MIDIDRSDVRPLLRKERYRFQDGPNGILVYDVESDSVFNGNRVAMEIMLLLDGNRTCRDVARIIALRYALAWPQVLRDTADFLRELARQGLLEAP